MNKLFLITVLIFVGFSISFVYATSSCVDLDYDGYYVGDGCELALDCNDNNPDSWRVDLYWVDYDSDGYYLTGLPNMNSNSQIAICYGANIPYPYVNEVIGPDCDDDNSELNVTCGVEDPQVPEFGVIAGIVALIAGLGIIAYRRK